jgi:Ni,Fe-hydrogenase I large subunit
MAHVVVDPVTRIEGHLRIEAEVDGGAVRDAWSSSTMFRGIEIILKGRDPRDAWAFTQRICGVCTTVHAIASIRAVEHAIGAVPPPNARLLRNLIIASQVVQDHVVHFYHLHALDWVDVVSALSADPAATAALAQSISDWPLSSPTYFAGVRDRLKGFVQGGRLGPFANAYWGHPAYRLPPAANLMAVAHYLEALDWQREFIKMHAVLGGKNPHLQSFLVGGMATPVDPEKQASLNAGTIARLRQLVAGAREFVTRVYIPDLLAVASFYKDWAGHGRGVGNYLVYGEYPEDDGAKPELFLPSGVIRGRDLGHVEDFDPARITEYVTHSCY